jgi:hypothetical protein
MKAQDKKSRVHPEDVSMRSVSPGEAPQISRSRAPQPDETFFPSIKKSKHSSEQKKIGQFDHEQDFDE